MPLTSTSIYPNLESVKSLEFNDSINSNLKKPLENKEDSTKLYYYLGENNEAVKSKIKFVCLKDFPENFKLSKYDYKQFSDEKRKGIKISIAIAVKENIQSALFDLLSKEINHISLSNDSNALAHEKTVKINEFLRVNTKKFESFENFEETYDKTTGDNLDDKKKLLENKIKNLEEQYKNFKELNLYETEELKPLLIKAETTYQDGLSILKSYDRNKFQEKVDELDACSKEFKTKIDLIEAVAKLKDLIDNVNELRKRLDHFRSKIDGFQAEEYRSIISGINALSKAVDNAGSFYDKDFLLGLESEYNKLNLEFTNLDQSLFGNKENKSAESMSSELQTLLNDLKNYVPSNKEKKELKEQLMQKISEIISKKDDDSLCKAAINSTINFISTNKEAAGKYTGWKLTKFGSTSDLGLLFEGTQTILTNILGILSPSYINDTSNVPSMALGRA